VLTRLDDRLLAEIAAAGGGAYEDIGDDRGVRSLIARLGDADTEIASERREAPDATLLLGLAALVLIFAEGALDGRRAIRHQARTGEAW
jgi:hypothetical protein